MRIIFFVAFTLLSFSSYSRQKKLTWEGLRSQYNLPV